MAIDPEKQIDDEERAALQSAANLIWFDSLVRHQIFLLRVAGSVRNETERILNATEADIAARIREGLSAPNLNRANRVIADVQKMRRRAWRDVKKLWVDHVDDLSNEEVKFLKKATEVSFPVEIEATIPDEKLEVIVKNKPFEGRTLKEWSDSIEQADLQRIGDQVKIGLVQGESSKDIARRVVGTAKLKGRDGVTQITRRQAEAITRTATIHTSNTARSEYLKDNSDLFDEELYVATLDGRTTAVCRANDGKRFPVGEGPQPPLHFNCRSLRVAAITPEAVGTRPARAATQKGLVREYSKQHGLGNIESRDKLPRGHKGAYDNFERRRLRELTEILPAKTTYQQWLSGQSAQFQDDVLGATKAKLFRKGNLSLDKFVNRAGDEIPLSELAGREAKAFRDAGLDPDDFK